MLDVYIPNEAQRKVQPSRRWAIAALVFALIGVAAAFAFVTLEFEPSPSAEDYVYERAFNEYAQAAVVFTAVFAPIIAIGLAIHGRAWFGVVLGVLAMLILAIAVPGLLRACCGGDEAGMIGTLRSINSSQQAYSSSCANGYYASDLQVLLKPPLTGGTAFTSVDVGKGYWRGYRVTMQAKDSATMPLQSCNGIRVGAAGYFVEAHHTDPKLGRRNFATDERGTVYQTTDGTVIQPGMAGAQPIQ